MGTLANIVNTPAGTAVNGNFYANLGNSDSAIPTPAPSSTSAPINPSVIKTTQTKTTPKTPAGAPPPAALDYSKYTNPATGQPYTPAEYADSIAAKANGGVVPNYATDALTGGPKTTDQLTNTAREINNTRNDVAVGNTDPYGVASKSGLQYTAAELSAIEKAQAGVYDPALNDVMNKLKTQQTADAAAAAQKTKEADAATAETNKRADMVTQANLDIAKWRATTGSKAWSGGDFTKTQSAKGASNADMTQSQFDALDPDVKNFYINPPTIYDPNKGTAGGNTTALAQYQEDVAAIKNGSKTTADVTADINNGQGLSPAVKAILISQLPEATPADTSAKKGFWASLFSPD